MRWKRTVRKKGDREIITRFLFIPLEINNEFRWLEKASYEVKYDYDYDYSGEKCLVQIPTRWVDEENSEVNQFSNGNNTIQSGRDTNINIKK